MKERSDIAREHTSCNQLSLSWNGGVSEGQLTRTCILMLASSAQPPILVSPVQIPKSRSTCLPRAVEFYIF